MEIAGFVGWLLAGVVSVLLFFMFGAVAATFAAGAGAVVVLALPIALVAPVALTLAFIIWLTRENGRARAHLASGGAARQTGIAVGRIGEW